MRKSTILSASRAGLVALAIVGLAYAGVHAQEAVAQLRGTDAGAGADTAVPAVAPLRAPITSQTRTSSTSRSNAHVTAQAAPASASESVTGSTLTGNHGVLSPSDVLRYSEIFRVDDDGQWDRADSLIKQLENPILIGHVQAERYLADGYKASFTELKSWLAKYADHPEADKVYTLALKKKRPGDSWPQKPTRVDLKFAHYTEESSVPDRANLTERREVTAIERHVRLMTAHEMPSKAVEYLESSKNQKILTALETDEMRSWAANSLFLEHVNDKAFDLAHEVAERNRKALPFADWTAGLAAWRLGNIEMASHHFEAMAHSQSLHRWNRASAAYWAARANFVAKKPELVSADLKIAASEPTTFYGLLALRQLGQEPSFNWNLPQVNPADYTRALAIPAVERAVALGQVGEVEMADQEMRRGHAQAASDLDAALISLSADYDLPGAQLHIAQNSSLPNLNGALYPIPPYVPRDGFTVDRALVFALMRQESGFKPKASSGVGAQGLMQIMPATAVHIANDKSLKTRNRDKLLDPAYNLALAQNYLVQLMRVVDPKGNLFMLAAAYDGGPGNARRWASEMANDNNDPLMFIESIPVRETRIYVERVLANLWLYRYRMGQPVTSLDQVAAGDWPIYDRQEHTTLTLADPAAQPSGVAKGGVASATLAPVVH